jgi:superfamily II DNA or RNA helicase
MFLSLVLQIRTNFSNDDIKRGAEYHRRGWVSDFVVVDSSVLAQVRCEQGVYDVEFDLERIADGVSLCTCRQSDPTGFCPHLWAVVLEFIERDLTVAEVPNVVEPNVGESNVVEPNVGESNGGESKLAPSGLQFPAPVAQLDAWITSFERRRTAASDLAIPRMLPVGYHYEFVIDLSALEADSPFHFLLYSSKRYQDGELGQSQPARIASRTTKYGVGSRAEHDRRLIFALDRCIGYPEPFAMAHDSWRLPADRRDSICSGLQEIGHWIWVLSEDDMRNSDSDDCVHRIHWDGTPYEPIIQLVRCEGAWQCEVRFLLVRGNDTVDLSEAIWAFRDGVILLRDRLIQVSPSLGHWAQLGRNGTGNGPFLVQEKDVADLLEKLTRLPGTPVIHGAEQFGEVIEPGKPQGQLLVRWLSTHTVSAQVEMAYGEFRCDPSRQSRYAWDSEQNSLVLRDRVSEQQILGQLVGLPFRPPPSRDNAHSAFTLNAHDLLSAVETLVAAGWEVRANGKPLRKGGGVPKISVVCNQDWFDVQVDFEFSGSQASLPALLKAVERQQMTVILDDGSVGILPEEWLQQNAALLKMADSVEGGLRFRRSQALLLDSLLSGSQTKQQVKHQDADFTQLVETLKEFKGVCRVKKPATFQGTLRSYQEEGLGWFRFLQDFHFGGCLADDMGLGKTIQVLALLETRRSARQGSNEPDRPSLVVVPKSLVFNWIDEAKRFTPQLRVLDYTGLSRKGKRQEWAHYDVIITTYGTLRRDVTHLKELEFDYIVLDEAQAIKNPNSQAAKASRLMSGHHRLAMTGTPVENHLGDLWSIMEFLNPGMLGRLPAFRELTGKNKPNPRTLGQLQSALAPFILRRTKEEVLTDLPEKTEQTILVDLSPRQRKQYVKLRDYYWVHLSGKIEELGLKRANIHVLEALLRTRQLACDPRLLDPHSEIIGAKVKCLLDRLETVVQDGSKALVFSQFTSLLNLVKPELKKRRLTYQYLDGKTQRRDVCVKRFQEDPDVSVFLISLKAGGYGLNLTAADYVFILDPWWNPAAEAQAIDRAHRIGQTRPVMAYRLIARDTIEEKIMMLQKEKRELADSIICGNGSLMQNLTTDDLATLFS